MSKDINLPVIGILHSPFHEKFGIPRQPNLVQVPAIIEFNSPYDDALAFQGLKDFSHLWLVWSFHNNKQDNKKNQKDNHFRAQIRPPRLGGNQKVGVFASRSMYRPAPIGLSVVELIDVIEEKGKVKLLIRGADLLNGTPIIDIKPYIAYSDAIPHAISGFAQAQPVRLQVIWQTEAKQQAVHLINDQQLTDDEVIIIDQLLALDPRPAYQDDANRVYGMRYGQVNVLFHFVEDVVMIDVVELYQF
jgi:tRNA-Thr(GGU) m(6)t(6)A37 methyltransferase TsaA